MAEATPNDARKPESVDIHVGQRIRARRKLLGITQMDLAAALGLTFQQVQKYERGANRVSASKLYAVGQALSCPAAYFFEGLDEAEEAAVNDTVAAMAGQSGGLRFAQLWLALTPHQRTSLERIAENIREACRQVAA